MRNESCLPLLKENKTNPQQNQISPDSALKIGLNRSNLVMLHPGVPVPCLVPVDAALKPSISSPEDGSKSSVFSGKIGICHNILVSFPEFRSLFSRKKISVLLDSLKATKMQAGTQACPQPLLTTLRQVARSCWPMQPPREREQARWARLHLLGGERGDILLLHHVSQTGHAWGREWEKIPSRRGEERRNISLLSLAARQQLPFSPSSLPSSAGAALSDWPYWPVKCSLSNYRQYTGILISTLNLRGTQQNFHQSDYLLPHNKGQ